MRWATYRHRGTDVDRVGLLDGGELRGLPAGETLVDHLADLEAAGRRARHLPAEVVAVRDVQLRPPVAQPPSVRDFYAFEQHVRTAREARGLAMEPDWYELAVFYFSNPHSVIGFGDEVHAPAGSVALDFELEVAAIVGREGRDLDPDDAESHLAGFCVMNDWSGRDVQRREMALGLGPAKGKDFATSLGPFLVTPDELESRRSGKAYDLAMTAAVNGREYSRASLAGIHWSFGELLAYASRDTRVVPGDVIGSGTCGTGCILELSLVHGSEAYPWLQPGDEVALTVERLGTLANRVVRSEGRPA